VGVLVARTIPLTKDKVALISDEDYELVSAYSWHAQISPTGACYASTRIPGSGRAFRMHRLILGAQDHELVDHANGDTLDNRRSNIRTCTPSLNNANARYHNRTGYRGVEKARGKYRARIWAYGQVRHLGTFLTAEEAARAYDRAASKTWGEFASLNFPDAQMEGAA
jgi:hypothetical protein